jgi:hypothetical protein
LRTALWRFSRELLGTADCWSAIFACLPDLLGIDHAGVSLVRKSVARAKMNSTDALVIIGAVIVATTAFGLFGVRKIRMSPQQFIVGGRSFGAVFLWLLMAGEVYTSFTFLGAAGWAYGKGAPAFYIICYLTLGCAIGIFVLPFVWRVADSNPFKNCRLRFN